MSAERLTAVLDGARHVTYCPDGLLIAWFGGHGLHVYALNGEEVGYRTVGDFSNNDADYAAVTTAARAYLCEEA